MAGRNGPSISEEAKPDSPRLESQTEHALQQLAAELWAIAVGALGNRSMGMNAPISKRRPEKELTGNESRRLSKKI